MRRRVRPGAEPADGVFLFADYPFDDEAGIAALNARVDAWCEQHGVNPEAVLIEAHSRGLLEQPWNPYEDGAL